MTYHHQLASLCGVEQTIDRHPRQKANVIMAFIPPYLRDPDYIADFNRREASSEGKPGTHLKDRDDIQKLTSKCYWFYSFMDTQTDRNGERRLSVTIYICCLDGWLTDVSLSISLCLCVFLSICPPVCVICVEISINYENTTTHNLTIRNFKLCFTARI